MKRFYAWGTLLGAVIGAGIFALPQAAYLSGWPYFLGELLVLALMLGYVHGLYARILDKNEDKNLLGLLREKLGEGWFRLGMIGIFGGILAALTGYLILGGRFILYIWPSLPFLSAVGILWILTTLPLFFRSKTFLRLESWATLVKAILIIGLGLYGFSGKATNIPQTGPFSLILPFGAIIFALAGWTAVEPVVKELGSKAKKTGLFLGGSIFIAALYALFAFGILHSAAKITPDTISGLIWNSKALLFLGVLGLFAIWTAYMPSALEIKDSFKFARLPKGLSLVLFLLVPLILVAYGVQNFLAVISLGGGVFIALEYLLILRLGIKVLKPKFWEKILIVIATAVFLWGGFYEIIFFLRLS